VTTRPKQEALAPRSDFPALAELTYLNTASVGLVPLPVQRQAIEFDAAVANRGTAALDEEAEIAVFEDTRGAAARLIGAHPDDVAITSSATLALGQIAWWLRPGAGANVVSVDLEFPSSTYPWLRVAEETGAEVRLVRRREKDPAAFSLGDVRALVDEQTAVVCITHVQYATGHRLDPGELAALAHEHGAVLVLDATQSAGMVPLDVAESNVDYLVAGAYKWLCSTFGAAICYIRADHRERFRPPLVGWRSAAVPYELDAAHMRLPATARKLEFSTSGYGAGIALGAAIDYVREIGVERILAHDLALCARLVEGLDALGAVILTPREDERRAGIVVARFPDRDGEQVAARLNERGLVVSPRLGSTRFSLHFFNDETDVERALETVEEELRA
jgi:cysteine desulfurase / selenocysteine lyase